MIKCLSISNETGMMTTRFSDRVNHDNDKANKTITKSNISLPGHNVVVCGTDTGCLGSSERAMTVGDLKKRYELRDVVRQVTMMNNNNNNNKSSSSSASSTSSGRR